MPASPGSRILEAPLPHAQLQLSGYGLLVQQLGQTFASEMPAHAASYTEDGRIALLSPACRQV